MEDRLLSAHPRGHQVVASVVMRVMLNSFDSIVRPVYPCVIISPFFYIIIFFNVFFWLVVGQCLPRRAAAALDVLQVANSAKKYFYNCFPRQFATVNNVPVVILGSSGVGKIEREMVGCKLSYFQNWQLGPNLRFSLQNHNSRSASFISSL